MERFPFLFLLLFSVLLVPITRGTPYHRRNPFHPPDCDCKDDSVEPMSNDDIFRVPPRIFIPRISRMFKKDGLIDFRIKIFGEPTPRLIWMFNDRPMQGPPCKSVDKGLCIIKFINNNPSERDNGDIKIQATNIYGTSNANFTIKVFRPPKINVDKFAPSVEEGTPIRLTGNIVGVPKPKIIWTLNGRVFEGPTCTPVANGSCRFEFNKANTKEEDSGVYEISATNKYGTAIFPAKIVVTSISSPPKIDVRNLQSGIQEKGSLYFEAYISGVPTPDIKWAFDGKTIRGPTCKPMGNGICRAEFVKNNIGIKDGGLYQITATNKRGTFVANVNVTVNMPPKIEVDKTNIDVKQNETIQIDALILGEPKPNITWKLNGLEIKGPSCVPTSRGTCRAKFVKNNANDNDTGIYVITASNEAGSVQKEISLNVKGPPTISVRNTTITVGQYQTLRIVSAIAGASKPNITWELNGEVINGPPCLPVERNVCRMVLIKKGVILSDAGTYQLTVSNELGTVTTNINVAVTLSPKVEIERYSDVVAPNETLTIKAIVIGEPAPRVVWKFNGTNLENITCKPVAKGICRSEIIRPSATTRDSGTYEIAATNDYGSAKASAKVVVGEPPKFDVGNLKYSVKVNGTIRIAANITGEPTPNVTWTFNGKNFEGPPCIIVRPGLCSVELVKDNATIDDGGIYEIIASNEFDTALVKASVVIYAPPKIEVDNPNLIVKPNDTLQVIVNVTGWPTPDIQWTKNGKSEHGTPCTPMDAGFCRAVLSKKIIDPQDAGVYEIEATNECGTDTTDVNVTIALPPKVDVKTPNRTVEVNDTIFIEAFVVGVPKPNVSWTFKGKALEGSPCVTVEDGVCRTEFIKQRIGIDDDGIFQITAINGNGKDTVDTKVAVARRPKITASKSNVTVQQNGTVRLEFIVNGEPRPRITWTFNGKPIKGSQCIPISKGRCRTEYVKYSANRNDGGVYKVTAMNSYGSSTTEISVGLSMLPAIKVENKNVTLCQSDSIRIAANITGEPMPKIKWTFNGQKIDGPSCKASEKDNCHLEFLKNNVTAKDSGVYKITATNEFGNVATDVHVTVAPLPTVEFRTSEQVLQANQTIGLEVNVVSDEIPELAWSLNDAVISGPPCISIASGRCRAEFIKNEANTNDSGVYKVAIKTKCANITAESKVRVIALPTIEIEGNNNQTSCLSQSLRLAAKITGIPTPNLTWTFNDEVISGPSCPSENVCQIEFIKNNLNSNDSGIYRVAAVNEAGNITAEWNISVSSPPMIVVDKPILIAQINESVAILVNVTGEPTPEIKWMFNEEIINGSQCMPVAKGLCQSQYLINNTESKHAGVYKIMSMNVCGNITANSVVKVVARPVIEIESNITQNLCQTQSIRFKVNVIGEPTPNITWTLNDIPIIGPSCNSSQRGVCRLEFINNDINSSDSGTYKIIAINDAGNATADLNVTVLVPPTIEVDKLNQVVQSNQSFAIRVNVTGKPKPELIWTFNDKVINGSQCILTEQGRCHVEMNINNINVNGIYKITAINSCGNATANTTVRVVDPPTIKIGNVNTNVCIANSVVIGASISGLPTPRIAWTFNKTVIPGPRCRPINANTCVAEFIKKVHGVSDAGIYEITAVNEGGNVTEKVNINVAVPPKIEVINSRQTVTQNDSIRIEINVAGLPTPNLTWILNGVTVNESQCTPLERSPNICRGVFVKTAPTLNDSGTYEVIANNVCGKVRANATVIMIAPPKIRASNDSYTLKPSDSLRIPITVSGIPASKISWSLNGKLIKESFCNISVCNVEYAKNNITFLDDGVYQITVTNEAGNSTAAVNVVVVSSPSITLEAPKVMKVNETLQIDAIVTGIPTPNITWTLGERAITGSSCRSIQKGVCRTTFINNQFGLNDDGIYKVNATNAYGTATAEANVLVTVPPSIEIKNTTLTVVQNNPVRFEAYVTALPAPKMAWTFNDKAIDGPPCVPEKKSICRVQFSQVIKVSGIFKITAINDNGSSSTNVTVTRLSLPTAPGIPDIVDWGEEMVKLHWNPPSSDGGSPITQYIIEKKNVDQTDFKAGTTVGAVLEGTVSGLEEMQKYQFRVSAVNTAGRGPPSDPTPVHTAKDRFRCKYKGRYYHQGQHYNANCNACHCGTRNRNADVRCENTRCLLEDDLFNSLNTNGSTWKATNYTQFWGWTFQAGLTKKLGTIQSDNNITNKTIRGINTASLPKAFDARQKWKLLSKIQDQDKCGISWGVSTVAVASDRLIIATNRKVGELSLQELISCHNDNRDNCDGALVSDAWKVLIQHGLVEAECYPWTSPTDDCLTYVHDGTECTSASIRKTQLHKFKSVYRLGKEVDIMQEILTLGPVQASMVVYQDFFSYQSGIYIHTPMAENYHTGYHSVRIVGWGEETVKGRNDPLKYWIAANSWGRQWGEGGYFRIVRGSNECGIEDFVLGVTI